MVGAVGRWETEDRDSAAVIEIVVRAGKPIVTGFDSMDGEPFKISAVKWDGKALSFTAYMPSTRHRTWHRFTPKSRDVVSHELTMIERWTRVTSHQ